jgi:hypothetical protein
MAYSEAKLKSNGNKAFQLFDYSDEEMHQTNVYLYGLTTDFIQTSFNSTI